MLNISEYSISKNIHPDDYASFRLLSGFKPARALAIWMTVIMVVFVCGLFAPWTQTIRAKGTVTARSQQNRTQMVNTNIAGQIQAWRVKEGDLVRQGDTLLILSEIKAEYMDSFLLDRQLQQVNAKAFSMRSYEEKVIALEQQIAAMSNAQRLKLEQAQNKIRQAQLKVSSDSADLQAAKTDQQIALIQLQRTESLSQQGIRATTDLEDKRMKAQTTFAKLVSAENKYLVAKNELLNAQIEISGIQAEYADKIAKAQSERYATIAERFVTAGDVVKLENQYANYAGRSAFYFILAPQDGYVTQILKEGIGETLKEGEAVLTIVPAVQDFAVDMYIRPMDMPLMSIGEKVRFIFDGWPAFVVSGWPRLSSGTFGGKVVAIDNFISENGMFRVLVAPDPEAEPWPESLRMGGGAQGIALLQNVRLGYELWRRINGFPPDFYSSKEEKNGDKPKLKAPVKSLK